MAKFMFVYRDKTDEQPDYSPEQIQTQMRKWGVWFTELGDKLVDGGDGLLPAGKVIHGDGTVTDGPFIEAKELVGGYSILEADSLDNAIELAGGCPITEHGGSIEIRELAGYTAEM
ncbi:MAG: YciI family protein [Planctomycetota bacterium]